MAADIGHISQLLNATLDPSQHRKGTPGVLLAPRTNGRNCPSPLLPFSAPGC